MRLPADVDLHRLHGSLDPAVQRAAIAAAPPGRRKLVLATSIAETSLTLDGVRIVVDSGLARRPRYDRAAGLTRLVTERASQAAVTQRAGRAGRQAPGRVYRLWEEAATQSLPRFDPPEILEADLSPFAARLRDLGRRRSARPALARSAARRGDRRGAGAAAEARRDRRKRPADAAWPRHRRFAAAAAPRPYADRGGGAGLGRDGRARSRCCSPSAGSAGAMPIWSCGSGAGAARRAGGPRRRGGWRRDGSASSVSGEGRGPGGAGTTPAFAGERGGMRRPRLSRTASPSAATRPAPTGSASAGAASGSIRPRRWRARPGWRSPRSAAPRRARASSPPRRSTRRRSRACSPTAIETGTQVSFDPATGAVRASHGRTPRRDPAVGRPGQPRRCRRGRGRLARRRAHARPRACCRGARAAAALRTRAAFARGFDPAIADLSDDALAAALDDWLPALLAGQAPPRRCRRRRLVGGARRDARLGGAQGGRPAGAEPFRDAGRQPPPDRLRGRGRPGGGGARPDPVRPHPPSDAGRRRGAAGAEPDLAGRAGRSRRRAICPASGAAAGPMSPRRCAAATRNIPGRTTPPAPTRRREPSEINAERRRAAGVLQN